jgi:hypothetical protein
MGTRTRVLQRIGAPFSAAAVAAFLSVTGYALAAGTTSGTVISNTASASYSDGTNTYTSTSNTVTTTVAPISAESVLLVSSVPGNTSSFGSGVTTSSATADGTVVTPQNTITDTYQISNTGNTSSVVTISSAGYGVGGTNNNTGSAISATSPVGDTAATSGVYTAYNCTAAQTNAQCITAAATTQVGGNGTTYTSESNLSSAVAGVTVAQGGYVLVQFNYNVGPGYSGTNSTVPDGTSPITFTGTTTNGGSGLQIPTGITATDKSTGSTTSSAAASATFFDQEISDGRLDVAKNVVAPTTGTGSIQYTINGNNGGGNSAKAVDLSAVIGAANCGTNNQKCIGYAVSDVIQAASNGNVEKVYDGVTGAGDPSGTNLTSTCPASNPVATVFYNTTTTPTAGTGWALVTPGTTNLQTARILVLICSSASTTSLANAPTLPSNPTSSGYGGYGFADGTTGSAIPTMPASPQIVLGFYTSQATVAANGVTQPNEANGIAQNNAPTSQIIGPGVNSGTTPNTTNEIAMLDNVTPQPTNGTGAPSSGYSNTTSTTLIFVTIGLGPYSVPNAKGVFSTTTPPTSAGGENGFWGTVPGSGSADTNHDFSVAAILGTIAGGSYPAANGTTTTPSTLTGPTPVYVAHTIMNGGNTADVFTVTSAQSGTANAVQSAGSATYTVTYYDYSAGCTATTNTTISAGGVTSSVAAGASTSFCVKYTPTGTVDAFDQKAIQLTATSQNTASVNNSTYDLLIAGGFIQMTKTVGVSGTAADGGTCSTTNAEPGCILTYTVAWTNTIPNGAAGTGATGNVTPSITGFTITEDGISNGWYNISSPTTSPTTGILTAVTITGDASGQVAYYKTASATYAKGGSCYPNTTAATAVSQTGCSTNASATSGGAITGPFGALVYVYGNSTTATVANASAGSISFPLIIRSTP